MGAATIDCEGKPDQGIVSGLSGLSPAAQLAKTSKAARYDEFPASLQTLSDAWVPPVGARFSEVNETQPREASLLTSPVLATQSLGRADQKYVRNMPEHEELPEARPVSPTDGFWRKLRPSTRPRESSDIPRASRSESRCAKTAGEEVRAEEVGSKPARWWNRIRSNAAKLVSQASLPAWSTDMPSLSIAAGADEYKPLSSVEATVALSGSLQRYCPDLDQLCISDNEEQAYRSAPQPPQRLPSRSKRRPPLPLLLMQHNKLDRDGSKDQPLSATSAKAQATDPKAATDREGSLKAWLRPLQLSATLRTAAPGPLPSPYTRHKHPAPSEAGNIVVTSPQRARLSVPALSSIKYNDSLPIPPRTRQSRASTISSMESRISAPGLDDYTQRTEHTQATVGSSILFRDEELRRAAPTRPPLESLPLLPSSGRGRARSCDSTRGEPLVSPREATDILFNLVSRFKNDGSPSTFRSASAATQTIASSALMPCNLTSDALRQRRGRRTTCTTLESILTYQSSSDDSSSFQSRTVSSGVGHSKAAPSQSTHVQKLIDGVLEDIADLISQTIDTSRSCSSERQTEMDKVSDEGPSRPSMSSIDSTRTKIQWPPVPESNAGNEPGQLRLLGAKLFSAMDIEPQDSPCPASKRLAEVGQGGYRSHHSDRISRLDLTKRHEGGFRTDLTVAHARIPIPKLDLQGMIGAMAARQMVVLQHSQPPSRTQPTVAASVPPTILVQRPKSEASTCSGFGSPGSAVIQRAKVVHNRTSSASKMDLRGVLRARVSSSSLSGQTCQGADSPSVKTNDTTSPSTPLSFASSSQPWSERQSTQLWSSARRNSFSTLHTDISPISTNAQPHKGSLSLSLAFDDSLDDFDEEEEKKREEEDSRREALEVIRWSRETLQDSEYVRQILSSEPH